jgi:hypothetical protein
MESNLRFVSLCHLTTALMSKKNPLRFQLPPMADGESLKAAAEQMSHAFLTSGMFRFLNVPYLYHEDPIRHRRRST